MVKAAKSRGKPRAQKKSKKQTEKKPSSLKSYNADQKIVWTKCGGMCCRCHRYCIEPSKNKSEHSLFGEVAHIKGEQPGARRYDGRMSPEARNRYPNLMLLCANCHTIVDKDDVTYTVALLEQMKDAKVRFVAEALKLKAHLSDAAKTTYMGFVSFIDQTLQLNRWENISDSCLRYLLVEWFDDALVDVYRRTLQFIYPGDLLELDEKIRNLGQHAIRYSEHFRSNATLRSNCYMSKGKARHLTDEEFTKYRDRDEKWRKVNRMLLDNLALAIRDFAYAVRSDLDRFYRPENRDFWLFDSMGVWLTGPDFEGAHELKYLIPQEYHAVSEDDLKLESLPFLTPDFAV